MSIKVQSEVWEHSEHKGSELLLLIKIADNADQDTRQARPGVEYLSRTTRMSIRAVQYNLRKLEKSGELVVLKRGGRRAGRAEATVYLIPEYADTKGAIFAPKEEEMGATGGEDGCNPSSSWVQPVVETGATHCTPTLLNHQEPSEEPSVLLVEKSTNPPEKKKNERGSRVPEDFVVTKAMLDWALERGATGGIVRSQTERFMDYWRAVPGARGRKLDWEATWRNWMARAIDNLPQNNARFSKNGERLLTTSDLVNGVLSEREKIK